MANTSSHIKDQDSQKSTRGGTPEQHAEAGRQSHKNTDSKSQNQGQQSGSSSAPSNRR